MANLQIFFDIFYENFEKNIIWFYIDNIKQKQMNMDKEFLLNNTFNYVNTQDDIVDIKIISVEHYYDNYYLTYYYFIENGKKRIDDVHDGAIYVQDGFVYLYRSIEEAKYFELGTAMIKIKLSFDETSV